VRADAVVQALEGYTAALRGARRDVLPLYSVMIATEPLDDDVWSQLGWAGRQTFHDGRRHLFYAQRTQDGRIAFGGRGAPYRYGSRIDDPVRGLGRLEVRLRGLLVEQFPSLHDVAVTHRWGGVLAVPRDWMPSVRYDARRGTAVAGGYSGDGVALANLAGRTVADLVTGTRSPLLDLPWVGHVSSRWEPEPLRWLGTSVGEWLATAADRSEERSARPSRVFGPAFSWLSGH
ncbi:MAG: NAD(P)/FAD-dependent oxidoreductase, partial [Actinomycetes bacterium]